MWASKIRVTTSKNILLGKNIMCLGSVKLVGNSQSDTLVLSWDFKCRIGNAGIGVKLLHFGQHLSASLAGVTFGWTATLNWFRLKTLSRQSPAPSSSSYLLAVHPLFPRLSSDLIRVSFTDASLQTSQNSECKICTRILLINNSPSIIVSPFIRRFSKVFFH